ncbi:hypothetical protein LTR78_000127 [Recurvomyces mirabilis]|uniref:Zn(2)-C6 fungal-type domain-containing protein n=1 Tax=Recurvomyces mirabilis TaxID=574656 RepID=A0AAE0WWJ9_9PEZI|nr:hypothetical protein LTR78_000127 [Recurvomyces mirabilis]KAK5161784.1 hypothetical protein LTS14_000129 [Recurvomyces mirabilis]
MADSELRKAAKPGKACLGCYRRKLKCSQEQTGCTNCVKANLPCVFPTADQGVKRKRGPYKKDKPPRERHLEHLVKYLKPQDTSTGAAQSGMDSTTVGDSTLLNGNGKSRINLARVPADKPSASEDLVKDALIALTQTSLDQGPTFDSKDRAESPICMSQAVPACGPLEGLDLTPARFAQYWQLYQARVDPVTKLLHCPTLASAFFSHVSELSTLSPDTQTLICSICFMAVGTCTVKEAEKRFGEPRESLLRRYSTLVESSFADDSGTPSLESLQALVLYMIGIRRKDDATSISALFGLARRLVQHLELNEDPGTSHIPLEAELRRRLWWHLCSVEFRAAEESSVRTKSIKDGSGVRLPGNYSDIDLNITTAEPPEPCIGRSDMTPVLLRWECQNMVHELWKAKRPHNIGRLALTQQEITAAQTRMFRQTEARLERDYVRYLHKSRPIDWWGLTYHELLFVKVRMMINHPFSQVPTKDMSSLERSQILQSSVAIINLTHRMVTDPRVEVWHWYGRGYVQWHSLAIVVAELGRIKNKVFASSAWAVLDPILADWDTLYSQKKEEPAWVHVNALITRARQLRDADVRPTKDSGNTAELSSDHATSMTSNPSKQSRPSVPNSYTPAGSDMSTNQKLTDPAFLPDIYDLSAPGALAFAAQQEMTPLSLHEQDGHYSGFSIDPPAFDMDMDLASFDQLDHIDFSAFDAVFGGDLWDFENLQGAFVTHCPDMMSSGLA